MAKQLVVLLENRPGSLAELTRILATEEINVTGIMLEGSLEFGTARIHVENARKAQKVLEDAGYQVTAGDVLVLDLPNEPGELARVCEALAKAKINIECLFGTTSSVEAPQIILKVSDVAAAKKALGL